MPSTVTHGMRVVDSAGTPVNKNSRPSFWLNLIASITLVVGLATSAWIFRNAGEDTSDVIGYVIVDGQSFPVTTRDSKVYRHNLERFGGKAAVFADDLNRWFKSLLRGRPLAIVTALSSIGIALACFRAAR